MANKKKSNPFFREFFNRLIAPDRWEAPDRNFVGHRDVLTRSLARYRFLAPYLNGRVLEIGCGRGYGLEAINVHTTNVVGVDVSFPFIREAHLQLPDIPLLQAHGGCLPLADDTFNVILAFEVIEHIEHDLAFLLDVKRVRCKGGIVAISTPNKRVASGNALSPLDRHHVREYTSLEFRSLLEEVFPSVRLYGQYEEMNTSSIPNRLIDRIPVRWKYLLPATWQGMFSALLRPRLQLDACGFRETDLESTHTFIALCSDEPV